MTQKRRVGNVFRMTKFTFIKSSAPSKITELKTNIVTPFYIINRLGHSKVGLVLDLIIVVYMD